MSHCVLKSLKLACEVSEQCSTSAFSKTFEIQSFAIEPPGNCFAGDLRCLAHPVERPAECLYEAVALLKVLMGHCVSLTCARARLVAPCAKARTSCSAVCMSLAGLGVLVKQLVSPTRGFNCWIIPKRSKKSWRADLRWLFVASCPILPCCFEASAGAASEGCIRRLRGVGWALKAKARGWKARG